MRRGADVLSQLFMAYRSTLLRSDIKTAGGNGWDGWSSIALHHNTTLVLKVILHIFNHV